VVLDRAINLTFHGIGDPCRDLEPGERDVWISGDQFLSVLDQAAGRRDVAITFDDGNASDLDVALPALRERRLTATFFVVAGRLGAPRFLDADAVRQLAAAGMRIGCHGMHHRPWRGLDAHALQEELVEARTILEAISGRPVTTAACPFGSYDRRVLGSLRRAGYRHVYTSDRGPTRPDRWLQPRNSVRPQDDGRLLDRLGSTPTLRRRAKLAVKRWR
jgi:peptidoglycan/xylan/chitin deacetylase (PgdA/CDA1 family)